MPHLTRDAAVAIHYETAGSGPPILFSTGFVGTTRMWAGQMAALAPRYRCIAYDMRGHGRSSAPADIAHYTETAMLDDMAALLDSQGIAKSTIAGLSLGGYLSFKFALRFPERVAALILMATGPGYRSEESAREWRAQCIARAELLRREGMEGFMRSGFSSIDYYTPPEIMRALDPIGIANVAEGIMANTLGADRLGEIRAPTLIMVGERDEAYLRGCNYIHKHIAHSKLIVYPDAGHGVNIDRPREVNAAIDEFLRAALAA